MRIRKNRCCPETSVPNNLRCLTPQKSKELNCSAAEAQNLAEVKI